jgi:hypothetical protein
MRLAAAACQCRLDSGQAQHTEKIDKISVYGGLDSVLKDLVKIRT